MLETNVYLDMEKNDAPGQSLDFFLEIYMEHKDLPRRVIKMKTKEKRRKEIEKRKKEMGMNINEIEINRSLITAPKVF